MLKLVLCVMLAVSLTQAASVLDTLKRLLHEEETEQLDTRGVYMLKVGSNYIKGQIQMDIKDCPDYQCPYTVKCYNSNFQFVKTYQTTMQAMEFSCDGLPQGTYTVEACTPDTSANSLTGAPLCGPRKASCSVPNGSCSFQLTKKDVQEDKNAVIDKIEGLLDQLRQ